MTIVASSEAAGDKPPPYLTRVGPSEGGRGQAPALPDTRRAQ